VSSTLHGRPLSQRERQVVELVARGYTDIEAAAALNMSVPTMRRRLELARWKLGARNRAHAAALAVAAGTVSVDR
jgi:DNA-binding CsgD family transcriptional regulator